MKEKSTYKVLVALILAIALAFACMAVLTACGDKAPEEENTPPAEEIEYSIYGNFTYEDETGKTTDSYGASWRCWVDTGNKFHLYGTLPHDDNTTSTVEFEGQVVNVQQYELYCAQVMFFTFTVHGEDGDLDAAKAVTSAYKEEFSLEYGDSNFYIDLVRTTNDQTETGNAGTFSARHADDEWDLSEGVWDYVLGLEA